MKRRKLSFLVLLALILSMALSITVTPALANSAQVHFSGVDATGAIMPDKESPIVVEKEVLTFDINEFPNNFYYYNNIDEFISYGAKVTAEYTFYNPSEYTVTSKLLFPFGNQPSYADGFYEENGEYVAVDDTNKYDITVNGEAIEKEIRHTLTYRYAEFELEQDLAYITDGFADDEFYKQDTPVTRYTFAISGVDPKNYLSANIGFDVKPGESAYKILFPESNGGRRLDNGDMRVHASVQKNEYEIDLYVFGQPLTNMPEWKVYANGGARDDEVIFGTANLVKSQTTTFKEYALANRPEQSPVSESDWYNALLAELKESQHYGEDIALVECPRFLEGFRDSLMRWYDYEITIAPNERLVNAVTAPIYPDINTGYTPSIHDYTYLLSPAKTWKEFGSLEIIINTPYYLNASSIEGFTKVNGGYTLTLSGLPEPELEFTLSESENPVKNSYGYGGGSIDFNVGGIIAVVAIILAITAVFAGGIITLIIVCKKRQNRQKEQNDERTTEVNQTQETEQAKDE